MSKQNFTSADFESLLKYPRTPHLEGSRLQLGDEGYGHIPYKELSGKYLVVEEKLDAANSGLSFNSAGELLLQCRGHYLTGGGRERQFNLFKRWAQAHESVLLARLEDRYVVYGEWMHKLHSVFYNALPHFFLEFDIWDRSQQCFLSTAARRELLVGLPILSVPVLFEGIAPKQLKTLTSFVQPSRAKTFDWKNDFVQALSSESLSTENPWTYADASDLSEGLYIKVELDGKTVGRYKWVRPSFTQRIVEGGRHHSEGPYIANLLINGVDIFSPVLTHQWGDHSSHK